MFYQDEDQVEEKKQTEEVNTDAEETVTAMAEESGKESGEDAGTEAKAKEEREPRPSIFDNEEKLESFLDLVESALDNVLSKSNLDISFEISREEQSLVVDFFGEEENSLLKNNGEVLEAFQIYISAMARIKFEERVRIIFDCDGYVDREEKSIKNYCAKIRKNIVEENRPYFLYSMSPKKRRLVHQYFNGKEGFGTESMGTGFFKNLKISKQ